MNDIIPFPKWQDLYDPDEDDRSPFYGKTYDDYKVVYNYAIHPYWDEFGSETLYTKILFADYEAGTAILELIGEWNDTIENDVMLLKRNVIEPLLDAGISKYVLICENVLNFHASDDCYYEEWSEECQDSFNGGWTALINTFEHVETEMHDAHIDRYFYLGDLYNNFDWRLYTPSAIINWVESREKLKIQRLKGF